MALVLNPLDGTYYDDGTVSATPVAPVTSDSSFSNGYTGDYTSPYNTTTGIPMAPAAGYSTGVSYDPAAWQGAGQQTSPFPTTGSGPNGAYTEQDYLRQMGVNVNNGSAANGQILNGLQGTEGTFFTGQNQILNDSSGLAGQSQTWANNLAGLNSGLAGASWNSATGANAADQQTLGQYTSALSNLSGLSLGNYTNLSNQLGAIPVLSAGGYGAPVISQAATAHADPASIAAQNQALSSLQSYASGSHDLQSQAAQAYANPQDVANQNMAANQLQAIAGGSLNVQNGQGDPEAYAAAHSALNQLSALTTPQETAAEKFILEQNRLAQEQQESSNRAAVMTDLRRRGMSGSGMEIGMNALAGAQNSENRLLGDLGAQAQAVDRSMTALGNYANLSSAMNSQGNQVSEFNSGMQASAQQAASNAYATLRAQGFSEQYARAAAADQMAQFNSTTDLNAANMAGGLASNMRSQSFNEDFSTKSASDQVAEFNKSQSMIQQRFQDDFAAGQNRDLTQRDVDIANQGNSTISQLSHNTDVGAAAQFGVTAAADQRTQGAIGQIGQLGMNTTNAQQNAINTGIGVNGQRLNTASQQLQNMVALGGAQISNNNNNTGLANGVISTGLGVQSGDAAANAAQAAANNAPSGLFGTGILGKHDPLNPANWFRGSIK